jgi:hypothetical protein
MRPKKQEGAEKEATEEEKKMTPPLLPCQAYGGKAGARKCLGAQQEAPPTRGVGADMPCMDAPLVPVLATPGAVPPVGARSTSFSLVAYTY